MSGQQPRREIAGGVAQPDTASIGTLSDATLETRVEQYQPRTADDLPHVFGRYRVVRKLGAGGMGAVYLAHDTHLDGPVALKVPHPDCVQDDTAVERFYREARAAFALRRVPGVCQVRDVGQIDGRHYLALDYIAGQPLSAVARTLSIPGAVDLVRRLAQTLEAAHAHGVVHRDLKPANVILDETGTPIVMDFGLARREGSNEPRLTHSGAVIGTPVYMPPEQVQGVWEQIGPRTDVYSLGMMLYEMLTGALPFQGSVYQILGQILSVEPARPSQLNPAVDVGLESICLTALAKDVRGRFASMSEFAAALETWLRTPSSAHRPPAVTQPLPRVGSTSPPRARTATPPGRAEPELRRLPRSGRAREVIDRRVADETPSASDETKECPACGETIKAVALRCRFCRADLDSSGGLSLRESGRPPDEIRAVRRTAVWLFILSIMGCLAPLLVIVAPVMILTQHRTLRKAGPLYVVLGYAAIVLSVLYLVMWIAIYLAA